MKRKETLYEKYIKRFLDVFLSSFAIIVLSPLLAVVALAVKIKLGSPVLFSQARPGKFGEIFVLKKFRTIHETCTAEIERGAQVGKAKSIDPV